MSIRPKRWKWRKYSQETLDEWGMDPRGRWYAAGGYQFNVDPAAYTYPDDRKNWHAVGSVLLRGEAELPVIDDVYPTMREAQSACEAYARTMALELLGVGELAIRSGKTGQ